jgi:hypothetical protein
MGDGMSDTDRQLGRAEQELRQAMAALQDCRDVLATILAVGADWGRVRSAKKQADFILALYASRQAGTECAAVGRDVLLAGLGVTK